VSALKRAFKKHEEEELIEDEDDELAFSF